MGEPKQVTLSPTMTENGTLYGMDGATEELRTSLFLTNEEYEQVMEILRTKPETLTDDQLRRLGDGISFRYPSTDPRTSPEYKLLRAEASRRGRK